MVHQNLIDGADESSSVDNETASSVVQDSGLFS